MENTPDKKVESTPEVQSPGRRKLLKILAAGGVVTAVSMVPSKWSSPVLKSGVLPAHAQTTPGRFTIVIDETSANVEIVDEETHFRLEANVLDNGAGLGGVEIRGELSAGVQDPVNVEMSNANGVVDFFWTVLTNNIVGQPVATLTFADQAAYGSASDTYIYQLGNGYPGPNG